MSKVIIADRVYIPSKLVDITDVKAGFERHVYKEETCRKCDNKPDRFNDICATCPAHLGFYTTWRKAKINDKKYISLPAGNFDYIEEVTGIDVTDPDIVIDKRSNVKAKHRLTFTKKLYKGTEVVNGVKMANQQKVIRLFWEHKSGLIKAMPRTGKTVMGTFLICAYGKRTLIVAHEKELLKQFMRALRNFTNLRELEKKTGRKIAGIIQFESDWDEDWDIVLCGYQKFIHPDTGRARLKKHVHRKFGLLVVDEVHRANAQAYSDFIDAVDTKRQIGLTATDKRKDRLEFLVEQIMGPVVVEVKTRAMVPTVYVHDTKCAPRYEWRGVTAYVNAVTWMAQHKERNKMLVKQIFADLRANDKHCIVVPVLRVQQAIHLTKMVNQQGQYNNEFKGEHWDDDLAMALYDKCVPGRDAVMKAARDGTKTRVVFSIVKMVREGVDVLTWTHLYCTFPLNNAANFFQMTQRICTPYEGKPQPIIRIFVDNLGLSIGCFASTWFRDVKSLKYKYNESTKQKAITIIESRKTVRQEDGGKRLQELW